MSLHIAYCLQVMLDSWPESEKIYGPIKEQADKIVYTSEEYTKGCMFKHNRHLVGIEARVCYLDKDTGRTAYAVKEETSK